MQTLSMNLSNEKFDYLKREFKHDTNDIIKNVREKDGVTYFQIDISTGTDLIRLFYAGVSAGINDVYKSNK